MLYNIWRLPLRVYKQCFHYTRPDTIHKVIRAPEWHKLSSEWRYVHRCALRRAAACPRQRRQALGARRVAAAAAAPGSGDLSLG